MENIQQKIYNKWSEIRGVALRPFAFIFTKLHLTASHITLTGVISMFLFILFTRINTGTSLLFLIVSILCDSLDGVLARYQKKHSDRGKFIDVVSDNFITFLFIFGLAYGEISNSIYMISYVYLMILSKSLRIFINSFRGKSDWCFKAVAGFLPNLINYLGYIIFLGVITFLPSYVFNHFFILSSVILFIDSAYYFSKIIKLES